MANDERESLDPKGAADVFTSQALALIALAQAMVECGVVRSEALIASLEDQMGRHKANGMDAKFAVPLAAMIQALRFEQSRVRRH